MDRGVVEGQRPSAKQFPLPFIMPRKERGRGLTINTLVICNRLKEDEYRGN